MHEREMTRRKRIAVGISERYVKTYEKFLDVCASCGRDPKEIELVAVSKTVGVDGVAAAYDAHARSFGENRPDQLLAKAPLFPEARWHFIGNIQSRRIKDIVPHAALIHSVYKPEHIAKIAHAGAELGKTPHILIEVNVSGEASKSGLSPAEVPHMLEVCAVEPGVLVDGFMTMAPQGDAHIAQETFSKLFELKERMVSEVRDVKHINLSALSMGMSEDWPQAIAEGATIVRIGRAIFSDDFN